MHPSTILFFLFTLAPSTILATVTRAIKNSLWDMCSPEPTASGLTSDYGCGPGLFCKKVTTGTTTFHQCYANSALEKSIWKECPANTCTMGSFCSKVNDFFSQCKLCRTSYVTCGPSAGPMGGYDCCPGRTCAEVRTVVSGLPGTKHICVPNNKLVKRVVQSVRGTSFCYSGCPPGIKVV